MAHGEAVGLRDMKLGAGRAGRMDFAIARIDDLVVVEAYADQGPTLKRIQPRARGRAYPILKKSSHITVVVSDV